MILYGRGVASIATQIGGTKEEAQEIMDNFFKSFPKVKSWMDYTKDFAYKNGYVEDLWGRRRRLPNIQLPKYEVNPTEQDKNKDVEFNPFLICSNRVSKVITNKVNKYQEELSKIKYRNQYYKLKEKAKKDNIDITDNTGVIKATERQCVNARVQGGAATMTKIAMNRIYRDEEMRKLGFKLSLQVHDELIGECPKENVDKVADRLTYLMKTSIQDVCNVPFKCDASICDHWYMDEMSYSLQEDYAKLIKDMSEEEAFNKLLSSHIELTEEQLKAMLSYK